MKIFKVSQCSPDPLVVTEIAELLKTGAVIAYPTDTFYGLGADVTNQSAIERLYSIKNRMSDKPILILISDRKMLGPLIDGEALSSGAERLMEKLWPGPLTLVFKASESVSPSLTAFTGKIGIRLSDNRLCNLLIGNLEHPITATSANLSGENSLDNPSDVEKSLGDKIDVLVDGGFTKGGYASTVVDVTGEEPVIIREGIIPNSVIMELYSNEAYSTDSLS